MKFIKRNYGWLIVAILASLPLLALYGMAKPQFATGFAGEEGKSAIAMLYHISGEFAIRWMTAVLTLTPFFILFGVTNLYVRQAMGISTAVWSLLHFVIFIWAEGFMETFTQVNYVLGFIAVLILIPLLMTSNKKSMTWLKSKWKKLQQLAYLVIMLSLLHVVLLEKTWLIYTIVVGIGFILRIPRIKDSIIKRRLKSK
jgi:sulfoxide reductase heme-binding subunit YedZ